MNKAFIKEQEEAVQHCPLCGSLGQPVVRATIEHWLQPDAWPLIGDRPLFCPFPTCAVAYFDPFARFVRVEHLVRPAWPKDPAAPMCGCFGLTCEDIEADIDEGGVTRLKEHNGKARSPEARCQTLSPSGQPCLTDVQRYYFKRRGGLG